MFRRNCRQALFLTLFVVSLMLFPFTALAQDPVPLNLEPFQIYLQANETVVIPVNGYCLNRGLPFPGKVMEYSTLSPDEVRVAIGYIVQEKYIDQDLHQTQVAIWHLTDGQRSGEEQELAEEIIAYATSGVKPADDGVSIMSLPEAVEQDLVSVQVTEYVNIVPPPSFYYGEGELTITNLTDTPQHTHLPYGVTFADLDQAGVQDMGMYASEDADPIDPPELPKTGKDSPFAIWVIYGVIALGAISLSIGLRSQRLLTS